MYLQWSLFRESKAQNPFRRFNQAALSGLLLFLSLMTFTTAARAQTSAFTYQGRLTDGGAPANGSYDFLFGRVLAIIPDELEDYVKTRLAALFWLTVLLCSFNYAQNNSNEGGPHSPAKGSAERQAILDALRGDQQVQFQVHYLKVHNGWCWVDTTPLDKQGHPTAEGGPNLLHLEDGKWKVMDLAKIPEDPNDPLGPEDASPTFVKNLMKTFPGVPRDIFPKPSK